MEAVTAGWVPQRREQQAAPLEAARQRSKGGSWHPLPGILSLPAKGSPAALPDTGHPCTGGQPGRGGHPDPHHGSRGRAGTRLCGDNQSPLLRVSYLPVHTEDACDKLHSCAKGSTK